MTRGPPTAVSDEPRRCEAAVQVRCAGPQDAEALARALSVEAADPLPRAEVQVSAVEAHGFTVTFRADEPAYLRAALNSYLKWLKVAEQGLRAAGSHE